MVDKYEIKNSTSCAKHGRLAYNDPSLMKTRKPCCRKETARCRKCSFLLQFANNIHYKYKTSQASKAATLQSSKHADA